MVLPNNNQSYSKNDESETKERLEFNIKNFCNHLPNIIKNIETVLDHFYVKDDTKNSLISKLQGLEAQIKKESDDSANGTNIENKRETDIIGINRPENRRVTLSLDVMEVGRTACMPLLNKIAQNPEVMSDKDLTLIQNDILVICGITIFLVTLLNMEYPQKIAESEPIDFYFWPGYISFHHNKKDTRVCISSKNNSIYEHGLGLIYNFQDGSLTSYKHSYATYWYCHALRDHKEDKPFTPGGTHSWTSSGEDRIFLRSGRLMRHLNVRCLKDNDRGLLNLRKLKDDFKKPRRDNYIDNLHGILTLTLTDDIPNWGKDIAEKLNRKIEVCGFLERKNDNVFDKQQNVKEGTHQHYDWPHSKNDKRTEKLAIYQPVREELYSLWLKACFDPPKENDNENWKSWIEKNLVNTKKIKSLYDRLIENSATKDSSAEDSSIENFKKSIGNESKLLSSHIYNEWYTMVVGLVPQINEKNEDSKYLGSAMLLTNYQIEGRFFHNATNWIERIYRDLRTCEHSSNMKYQTQKEQQTTFAHTIIGLLSKPKKTLEKCVKHDCASYTEISDDDKKISLNFINIMDALLQFWRDAKLAIQDKSEDEILEKYVEDSIIPYTKFRVSNRIQDGKALEKSLDEINYKVLDKNLNDDLQKDNRGENSCLSNIKINIIGDKIFSTRLRIALRSSMFIACSQALFHQYVFQVWKDPNLTEYDYSNQIGVKVIPNAEGGGTIIIENDIIDQKFNNDSIKKLKDYHSLEVIEKKILESVLSNKSIVNNPFNFTWIVNDKKSIIKLNFKI